MSHGHESRHRFRNETSWLTIAGWAIAALLGAHLALGAINRTDEGRPKPLVPEEIVLAIAFWVPILILGGVSSFGIYWSWRTWRRREKSSLLWTAYAFTFSALAALLLAAIGMSTMSRQWLACAASALCATMVSFFAVASYRDYTRSSGSRRGHRSSSADEDDDTDDAGGSSADSDD